MSQTEWQRRCEALAAELVAACAAAIASVEIRLEDRTTAMLAEEEDPQVPPHWPIGLIYRYRLRERRAHFLFGRRWLPIRFRRTIVSFGLEEMFDSSHWTRSQGLWCVVDDDRLVAAVRPVVERFAAAHALKLDFAPRAA